jgi:phenol 2-monooxygenase
MNVSMMDSYNLSWKLAHSILGLTPKATNNSADPVLETFAQERVDTAGLTHDEFLKVFRDGSGFTSGCGLEYKSSKLVRAAEDSGKSITSAGDPLHGALTPGRRVLNVELKRYADNSTRQLHDGKQNFELLLIDRANLACHRTSIEWTIPSSRPY